MIVSKSRPHRGQRAALKLQISQRGQNAVSVTATSVAASLSVTRSGEALGTLNFTGFFLHTGPVGHFFVAGSVGAADRSSRACRRRDERNLRRRRRSRVPTFG